MVVKNKQQYRTNLKYMCCLIQSINENHSINVCIYYICCQIGGWSNVISEIESNVFYLFEKTTSSDERWTHVTANQDATRKIAVKNTIICFIKKQRNPMNWQMIIWRKIRNKHMQMNEPSFLSSFKILAIQHMNCSSGWKFNTLIDEDLIQNTLLLQVTGKENC